MKKGLILLFLVLIGGFGLFYFSTDQSVNVEVEEDAVYIIGEEEVDITQVEREGIEYMLEEEKLARDVYAKLYEKYEINVFKNISQSEQRHIDAVHGLVEMYDIDYYVDEEPGVFGNETIQNLYNDLVEKGEKSLVDALYVGATIEDLDIYDISNFLETVDTPEIEQVYSFLLNGSKNHLRAFNNQLLKNGADAYEAQYISDQELVEILEG